MCLLGCDIGSSSVKASIVDKVIFDKFFNVLQSLTNKLYDIIKKICFFWKR